MEFTKKVNMPVYAALILALIATVVTLVFRDDESLSAAMAFPNLSSELSGVAVINIDSSAHNLTLIKNKNDAGQWFIGELGGYPAVSNKISDFIRQLAVAQIKDVVTINPAEYALFGVEGITTPLSGSRQVAFVDYTSNIPLSFIIGKTDKNGDSFIRKTDSREVWKINQDLSFIESSPIDWINNKLLDIDTQSITEMKLTDVTVNPKETVTFTKQADDSFSVKANFDSAKITSADAVRIIKGLDALRFTKVSPLQDIKEDMQTVFKSELTLKNKAILIINFVKVGESEIWLEVLSTDKTYAKKYEGWLYLFPWRQILDIMPENIEGVDENV